MSIFPEEESDNDVDDDSNGDDGDDDEFALDANARQYRTVECRSHQARKKMDVDTIRNLLDGFVVVIVVDDDDDWRSRFLRSKSDDVG